jgi:hypothetical protein
LVVSAPDGLIALARGFFQASPVDDRDATPPIADEPSALKKASGHRHRRASDAQHGCEKLLRQLELILKHTVPRH